MAAPVWIFDTSSLIAVKASLPRDRHERVFAELTRLVQRRRLVFPREVIGELRRERRDRRKPRAIDWAIGVEKLACRVAPSFADVRTVLTRIPEIVDAISESATEQADPWVLALGDALKRQNRNARVVTEEIRDVPPRISLDTACGVLGIPTVRLREFLQSEIRDLVTGAQPPA